MIISDFLIIGSGILGMSIAREIKKKYPDSNIVILEKEADVAFHSSGRNSGVLHAGFYYSSDSLKAKFCREGNKEMKEFCKEKNLKLNECKKVVVAQNEKELNSLFELANRANKNKVDVKIIDEKELSEIEPNAVTFQYALFSPTTATVDPLEVNLALKKELSDKGVKFYFSEGFSYRVSKNLIKSSKNNFFLAEKIINCAGLYADKIAKEFNFSENYTIIPFKGIYLKYSNNDLPVKTNIYPVPNLKNPFLGVHFTVTADKQIKIGPTAIPAFWRENYKGFENFNLNELSEILWHEAILFFSNAFGFRNLAFEEMKKYNKKYFISQAIKLVKNIDINGFKEWTKPGIRAQLINKKTKELVQDFIIEGDDKSIHILNAVSPAFTCSFPFARYVVENYIK